MEKKELINEIVNFCSHYRLFKKEIGENEMKNKIRERLEESDFIENLVNTIHKKTTNFKYADFERKKALLLELESIRLDLEHKDILDTKICDNSTDIKSGN